MFFAGCQLSSSSSSVVKLRSSADPNQLIELQGQAAKDYAARIAEAQAANMQTAKGRQNEMLAELKKTLPYLVLVLVAGLAFWGFTRSRFGWVTPAASLAGIVLIIALGRWAEWITAGVILLALGVIVWKAIEYQKERNINGKAAEAVRLTKVNAVSS